MPRRKQTTIERITTRTERWCSECKEVKDREYFHKDKNNLDGLYPVCKVCRKVRTSMSYERHKKTILEKSKKYAQTAAGKMSKKISQRNFVSRYPQKYKARNTTRNAIRDKRLLPQPCEVCGDDNNINAHHTDYLKPMDVMWLCRQHHMEWHKKYTPLNNRV